MGSKIPRRMEGRGKGLKACGSNVSSRNEYDVERVVCRTFTKRYPFGFNSRALRFLPFLPGRYLGRGMALS